MNKEELVQNLLNQISEAITHASGPIGNHFIFRCSKRNGALLKEYFEEKELNKLNDEYWLHGNGITIDDNSTYDHVLMFNFSKYHE